MSAPLNREAVVRAATEMISGDGLERLSLRKLAAGLGVTAPALYAHVGGKRELLAAVAESQLEDLAGRLRSVEGATPLERVRALAVEYVRFARERPRLFETVFHFRPEASPAARAGGPVIGNDAFDHAAGSVAEAIEAGLLDRQDPAMASLVLWTAVHGVATVVLSGPGFDPELADTLTADVVDTVIAGMRRDRRR